MIKFIETQTSLFLILLSAILTGAMASPNFALLIVHVINLSLLFLYRWECRKPSNNVVSSVLLLLSLGLTSVETRETSITVLFQLANVGVLLLAWWFSKSEGAKDATP